MRIGRILRPGGVFAAYDYDWPPMVHWEANQAFAVFMDGIRALRTKHGIHSEEEQWGKDQHADRISRSRVFRHVSEISWEPRDRSGKTPEIGDELEFRIIKMTPQERKIGLSLKAMQPAPPPRPAAPRPDPAAGNDLSRSRRSSECPLSSRTRRRRARAAWRWAGLPACASGSRLRRGANLDVVSFCSAFATAASWATAGSPARSSSGPAGDGRDHPSRATPSRRARGAGSGHFLRRHGLLRIARLDDQRRTRRGVLRAVLQQPLLSSLAADRGLADLGPRVSGLPRPQGDVERARLDLAARRARPPGRSGAATAPGSSPSRHAVETSRCEDFFQEVTAPPGRANLALLVPATWKASSAAPTTAAIDVVFSVFRTGCFAGPAARCTRRPTSSIAR